MLTYVTFSYVTYPYGTFKQVSIQFIFEILYEEYILLKSKFYVKVQSLGTEQKLKFPMLLYKN